MHQGERKRYNKTNDNTTKRRQRWIMQLLNLKDERERERMGPLGFLKM